MCARACVLCSENAAAVCAGAMTGGKRRGLVEKEQLCVGAASHDGVLVALEGEHAADPRFVLPAPGEQDLAIRIVNDAAVAHHGAARGDRADLAGGSDSIL